MGTVNKNIVNVLLNAGDPIADGCFQRNFEYRPDLELYPDMKY
jgi:hypothetical protein